MNEDLTILHAKVGLLEVLVRALLKNECGKHPDPAAVLESIYSRFKPKFEARAKDIPEKQSLIFLENFEIFFDLIRMDLRKADEDRKS